MTRCAGNDEDREDARDKPTVHLHNNIKSTRRKRREPSQQHHNQTRQKCLLTRELFVVRALLYCNNQLTC